MSFSQMKPLVTSLHKTLSCDVIDADERVFKRLSFFGSELRNKPHIQCFRKANVDGKNITCKVLTHRLCVNSSTVIVKTIRAPMYFVEPLMESLATLKVIYYTRDPRGIMSSRRPILRFNDTEMVTNAKALCLRMAADWQYFQALRKVYPERIVHIKYESLAASPMEYATGIYRFLGQPMDTVVSDWVKESTHANSNTGTYGTRRTDSKKTSEAWQSKLSAELIRNITGVCKQLLLSLDYPLS